MTVQVVDAAGSLSSLVLSYSPSLDAIMAPTISLSSCLLALVAAICGQNAPVAGWSTPPNATTLNGTYAGVYNAEYHQDFFLGVPYAQPPLGELRFANPRSLNASFEGTRNASEYSNECVGYGVSPRFISSHRLSLTRTWIVRSMGIHHQ